MSKSILFESIVILYWGIKQGFNTINRNICTVKYRRKNMKEKCLNCGKEIGFFGKLIGLKKNDKYLCDNCYGKIKEVKKLCSFNEKNISMDNLMALLNFYPNLQPAFDEKNTIWQKYSKYITDIDKMISILKTNLEYTNNLHKENLKEFARSMNDYLKNAKEWRWHELYGKTGDDAIYYI